MEARRNTRMNIGTAPTLKVRIRRAASAALRTLAGVPVPGPRRRRTMKSMLVIGLLCALLTPTAAAQCRSPEYRQFDFWVGDWDAYDLPDTAKAVARIQVSSIMDGCALREVYVQKD